MKLVEVTNYQKSLDSMSEQDQILAVKKLAANLQHINNPSEAVQLAGVDANPYAISWIKNPSETVQLAAASKLGEVIGELPNPSEEVQLAAVNQDAWSIQNIDEPTPKVQQAAVDRAGWEVLQYVRNRSPAVVKNILTHFEFISDERLFHFAVTTLLKGNDMLIKKWLRYGETVRNNQ
jgi:hypothetical protein